MTSVRISRSALLGITSVALALGWGIFRVSPQSLPHIESALTLAYQWPNSELPDSYAFMRHSPLGPWAVQFLQISSPTGYLLLHTAIALVALASVAAWVAWNAGTGWHRWKSARLFALSPLVAVVATGLGSYDAWTLLCFALVMWAWQTQKAPLILLASALVGIQHFEQGLVALLAAALLAMNSGLLLPSTIRKPANIAWSAFGLVLGKVSLLLVLQGMGVDPFAGRSLYLADPELLRIALTSAVNYLPIYIYSLLAGLWALIFFMGLHGRRSRRTWTLPLAGGILFAFSAVTLDHTRVFALMSLPALLLLLISFARDEQPSPQASRIIEGVAWVSVPIILFTNPDGVTYFAPLNWADHLIMFTKGWLL